MSSGAVTLEVAQPDNAMLNAINLSPYRATRVYLGAVAGWYAGANTGAITGGLLGLPGGLAGAGGGALTGAIGGGIGGAFSGAIKGWYANSFGEAVQQGAQAGAIDGVIAGVGGAVLKVVGKVAAPVAKAALRIPVVQRGVARLGSTWFGRLLNLGPKTGLQVATGMGEGAQPLTVVRTISRGERVANIIEEMKSLTYTTGNEHALVTLADGSRAIVSGGPGGITFAEGQITRLFAHSHPYQLPPTGPSGADINALRVLRQRSSYLLEHGRLYRFSR